MAYAEPWRARLRSLGVAAAVALLPSLVCLNFDALETLPGRWGVDGGIDAFAFVFTMFVASWLPGLAVLATVSGRPTSDGLLAGALVALVMGAVLVRIHMDY